MKFLTLILLPSLCMGQQQERVSGILDYCALPNTKFLGESITEFPKIIVDDCRTKCKDNRQCVAANHSNDDCILLRKITAAVFDESFVVLFGDCDRRCWSYGTKKRTNNYRLIPWAKEARTCAIICAQDRSQCHFWDFDINTGNCYLGIDKEGLEPAAGYFSSRNYLCKDDPLYGDAGCGRSWTTSAGETIKEIIVSHHQECLDACRAFDGCIGVWYDGHRNCHFKNNLRTAPGQFGYFSPPSCFQNCFEYSTRYISPEIGFYDNTTPNECQTFCKFHEGCNGFSYDSETGRCSVHADTSKGATDILYISGPKEFCNKSGPIGREALILENRTTLRKCVWRGRRVVGNNHIEFFFLSNGNVSADACESSCRDHGGCKIWSFHQNDSDAKCRGSNGLSTDNGHIVPLIEDAMAIYGNVDC